ncbi:NADH-ubiquinone oxidoreductase-like protein 299 kDa subunit [Sporormia fimetaria CBS 119925]|uniref:NADH-ubiquinone oxidoreductase-like protein 299 kDa subunit n=1 Tax=Sporormia fimetaria CBS 119925 TaxID=1340428 RepID=A0A6A6VHP8_9PLEO|nr:NADH-ubiquinone oxidoreductase-like protein 299 kDa subunit [Sporormia fimetaria CBS 119925]
MRAASRLLATVKQGAQYLEPGAPTGLTGLLTHPTPRSTLKYLYQATLDKLKEMPESSVYRQSTEALTKHRLSIIDAAKPAGWDAWAQHMHMIIDENPRSFEATPTSEGTRLRFKSRKKDYDFRRKAAEWDGEQGEAFQEGTRPGVLRGRQLQKIFGGKDYAAEDEIKDLKFDPEPQLTAEQVSEVESQIGAGLIEEVIQVAEGELKLAGEMLEAKPWEPLEEPAPEGQWTYFERGGHTKTQAP